MQYTLEEIGTFLTKPDQYKQLYTEALLEDLVATLFPDDHDEVSAYLELLPDHANHIRIRLACVHLSADSATEKGSMDKLVQNIDSASTDYRDLLMAYYL